MAVYDALLTMLEAGQASARWNFPLAVGTELSLQAGLGTGVALTYSFMAAVPGYESPDDHPGFAGLDAGLQAAARRALAAWAAVANLTFTEVADAGAGGQLRFGQESIADAGGYAYAPGYAYTYDPLTNIVTGTSAVPWAGDIYLGNAPENAALAAGEYGYQALLHEIGHALGLQHPFEGADPLPAAEATLRYSVMAYDAPANLGIVTVTGDAHAYAWVAETLYPSGPMLYDIAALQLLYGANMATNAGATTYAWAADARILETIWDGGGIDTIDASNQALPSVIDLRDGHFSSIAMRLTEAERRLEIPAWASAAPTPGYDGVDNLAIAFGAVIENAKGGAGDDHLIGNAVANLLEGNGGADTLDGGAGDDTLAGGAGDDTYLVDSQGDLILEAPGGGVDSVIASAGFYLHAELETLVLAEGAGDIFGVGNALANRLEGNAGANLLMAWGGDDTLLGGVGDDVLYGVDGRDSMEGGAGLDVLLGGEGDDTLAGGADADALYGEAGDDSLSGGTDFVFDLLVGGEGNDTLEGASGLGDYDYLYGGAGGDAFYVDTPADLVFEFAGEGSDTVHASIEGAGYYLYEEIEDLVLLGPTPFGVGNGLANRIAGNAGANWLLGGAGDDTLDGGAGSDVLFGEAGADVFAFRRGTGADVVGDFAPGVDKLLLIGLGFADFAQVMAHFVVAGGNSAIDFGQGDLVVLNGVTGLAAGDVLLA
ncbi:M10 family metallopeptidase C-terminal domain-containing protein [Siccirubricoccus sp. KC 17139]|uniref:M10 family metallopeptidase C-terminal domain-containing protein n=1 Tax=Siccirubricoccus soli TaxID=2899147 RepID=A0ABT1DC79_9PROT|nr:M10 family metallopeptidase [Siccirubricoccus soli]MCO6418545.1 M10 family metallopeptidase C-terminal domain-containing protein [Siccirubricoccus soli]MCP2684680.1 M10 family metallopeptidase C-terminal domain-containing protein [Siccirubricoccus soli]